MSLSRRCVTTLSGCTPTDSGSPPFLWSFQVAQEKHGIPWVFFIFIHSLLKSKYFITVLTGCLNVASCELSQCPFVPCSSDTVCENMFTTRHTGVFCKEKHTGFQLAINELGKSIVYGTPI